MKISCLENGDKDYNSLKAINHHYNYELCSDYKVNLNNY